MPTLRDKFAIFIASRICLNPEKKDRVIKKLKAAQKIGVKWATPNFKTTRHDLPDGGKYELAKPKKEKRQRNKLIMHIHGGVFIMGLTNIFRNLAPVYSKAADGAAVLTLDYRTAPAFTYPTAHDDMRQAWQEATTVLGYNPKDIVLVGDSAGANLILSLLLKLRNECLPLPAAAVTMSPWADLLATGNSYTANYKNDVMMGRKKSKLDLEENRQTLLNCGLFAYAKDADRADPYLSPLYGDYHNLPPILMTAGGHELLLDDTLTIAQKIKDAEGSVEVIIGEGMFHSYPLFRTLSTTAKKDFGRIKEFIKYHLAD